MADSPTGRRPQTVRIYLRHHNDPEGRFTPKDATCETDEEKHRTGCGASIRFYLTYPNQKRMPFDGEPVLAGEPVVLGDGGVVASVFNDKVHFSTCPHARGNDSRRREAAAAAKGAA
jgi:hypothetical protein